MSTYKLLTVTVRAKQTHRGADPWGNPVYEWAYDTEPFETNVQAAMTSGATLIGGISVVAVGEGLWQPLVYTQAVLFP